MRIAQQQRRHGIPRGSSATAMPIDTALILAAAGLVALLLFRWAAPGYLSNDGAQALSTLEQLLRGNGLRTTTIFYEVQARGGMPALQTVWPPGLPAAAVAVAALTGLDGIAAMGLLNAAAHTATALLLFHVLRRLLPGSRAPLVVGLCALAYTPALTGVLGGGSEPLFTLALLASAACLHRAWEGEGRSWPWLLGASLAVGLACAVRYLGVAFVAALGLLAVLDLGRNRFSRGSVAASTLLLLPAASIPAGLVLRNLLITGEFTGGPAGARGYELPELLFQAKWAAMALLGGVGTTPAKVATLAFAAAMAFAGMLLARRVLRAPRHVRAILGGARSMLVLYALSGFGVTLALILFMAARRSAISLEGRYLVPCVPLLLVAAAALVPAGAPPGLAKPGGLPRRAGLLLIGCGVALTVANAIGFAAWLRTGGQPAEIARLLDSPRQGGSLRNLLRAEASEASPVMSNQSQALHVALGRPTLGVPERRLTPRRWDTRDILDLADRFGATYLLVFLMMPLGAADGGDDYILQMVRQDPAALELVQTDGVLALYRLARHRGPGLAAAVGP